MIANAFLSTVALLVALLLLFSFGVLVGAYIGTEVITRRFQPLATQQRETFMKALEGYLLPVAATQAREIAALREQANELSAMHRFFAGEQYEGRMILDADGKPDRVYGFEWRDDAKTFVYRLPTHLVMRLGRTVAGTSGNMRAEQARFN